MSSFLPPRDSRPSTAFPVALRATHFLGLSTQSFSGSFSRNSTSYVIIRTFGRVSNAY